MRLNEIQYSILIQLNEARHKSVGKHEHKGDLRLIAIGVTGCSAKKFESSFRKLVRAGYIESAGKKGIWKVSEKGILTTKSEAPIIEPETPIVEVEEIMGVSERELTPEAMWKREKGKPKPKWTPQHFEYDEETEEYKVIEE